MKNLFITATIMLLCIALNAQPSLYNDVLGKGLKGKVKMLILIEYPYKTGGAKPVIDDKNLNTHTFDFTVGGTIKSELIASFENGEMADKNYYVVEADANGIPASGKFFDNNNNLTHYSKYEKNSDTSYAYSIYNADDKMEGQMLISKNRSGRTVNETVITLTGGTYDIYLSRTLTYDRNIIEKEQIETYFFYEDKSLKLNKSETYHYYNEKQDKHGNPVNYLVRNKDMVPVKYIDCMYEYYE